VGALLGLMFGLGLLLVWRARATPRPLAAVTWPRWLTRRTELIRQAGIDGVGPWALFGAQVVIAVGAGLIVLIVTATVTVAACFAAFAFIAPVLILRRMRRRRQVVLRELWPEAIDNLASAVRAGMSLPEGVTALALRGPEPLRPPFARFGAAYRASGRFGDCLDSLKADLADPVGDRVCETLRVAREVGGNDVGTVLRTLSELLRSDARTRAELEVRQGWVVNAARLAVASPWLVLLLLSSQSSTVQSFDSAGGGLLLAIGAAVCVIAYRLMLKIGELPQERRVLQ
jgi:tight adherence protein B